MKSLTKEHEASRTRLIGELQEAYKKVEEQFAAHTAITEKVNEAIAAYNDVCQNVETFRDEVTTDMQSYIDERSEKWQDGDSGQEYTSWKETWDALECSGFETVQEETVFDEELSSALSDLPGEPGTE